MIYLVMELVALVFIVHSDSQDGRIGQQVAVRLVHLGDPFVLGETGWHVVDVLDPNTGRAGALQSTPVHGHYLQRQKDL